MGVTRLPSSWTASSTLFLGAAGGGNRLVVRDGGEVIQNSIGLTLGAGTTSLNNRLLVAGGSLRLVKTNLGSGILDLRRGTNVLDAGLIEAAQLLLTNALGFFEFNGGTLAVGDLTIGNNQSLRVGNGVSPATLRFKGDGQHAFGSSGVTVSSNGVLTGSGTAAGALAVDAGGLLSPGNGIGRLAFTRIVPPKLRGTTLMEISRTNGVLINDVLQTAVTVAYGGSLIVSNVGPGALVAGDRFRLFVATGYFGAFTNVVLPPLDPGLDWENSLTGDGSIGVIVASQPGFAGLLLTGTNLVFSGTNGTPGASYAVLTATNVTLPLSNWVSLVTNQFSASGQFTFTNGIAPTDPQRYFRLRTP